MSTTHIQLYRDRKKSWRWRALRQGRIVADGGQGYQRKGKCRRSIERLLSYPFVVEA